MKILAALTSMLWPLMSLATEHNLIFVSTPKSPGFALMQAYAANMPGAGTVRVVSDCAAAVKKLRQETNVTVLMSADEYVVSRRLGLDCQYTLTEHNVVFMSEEYYDVCHRADRRPSLVAPDVTLGRASMQPIQGFQRQFNRDNQASLRVVGMPGSGGTLASLLSGEIDWGIIAKSVSAPALRSGKISCPYDTTPDGDRSLAKSHVLDPDHYKVMWIMFTNSDHTQAHDQAWQHSSFQRYLSDNQHFNQTNNVQEKNLKDLQTWVDALWHSYQ